MIAFIIFQTDPLNTLYSAGTYFAYANDSWKFIANTLDPVNPPYPYHLVATSLHFLLPYSIISLLLPPNIALYLSILLIQYLAALFTVFLLYNFLFDCFELKRNECLALIIAFEFLFMSPFLILASSEILFLFYQILAWTFFYHRRYLLAAIAASMTFALRFNGAFFVIGLLLVYIGKWWKEKDLDWTQIFKIGISIVSMFLIGFSSFIQSWVVYNDFWVPLTYQNVVYRRFLGIKANDIFGIPFFWWLDYVYWILSSSSIFELAYFILGVLTFGLGLFSVYKLIKWSQIEKLEYQYHLTIIFLCSFLGINFLTSVSNYARFQSTTFPLFPVFPLLFQDHNFSSLNLKLISIGSIMVGLLFNTIWWLTYII
ncbi:MAG: hypothetical protein ACFFAU_17205 [Candidatus Hodarchaeota archaeon]